MARLTDEQKAEAPRPGGGRHRTPPGGCDGRGYRADRYKVKASRGGCVLAARVLLRMRP